MMIRGLPRLAPLSVDTRARLMAAAREEYALVDPADWPNADDFARRHRCSLNTARHMVMDAIIAEGDERRARERDA